MTNPTGEAGGTPASDAAAADTRTPAPPAEHAQPYSAYPAPYPQPYGHPVSGYGARPAPKVSTVAIWSVVASALGLLPMLFGLTSVIGVALGVIALNRMRFTGESGRGLAIAGIAVGAVTFLASWLIGIAFLTSGPALR